MQRGLNYSTAPTDWAYHRNCLVEGVGSTGQRAHLQDQTAPKQARKPELSTISPSIVIEGEPKFARHYYRQLAHDPAAVLFPGPRLPAVQSRPSEAFHWWRTTCRSTPRAHQLTLTISLPPVCRRPPPASSSCSPPMTSVLSSASRRMPSWPVVSVSPAESSTLLPGLNAGSPL